MKNRLTRIAILLALMILSISAAHSGPRLHSNITGAWYDPAFAGSGFLIEMLPDDRAVVYWFTYDGTGAQQWFVGVGNVGADDIVIDDLQAASGGRFGPGFDPQEVGLRTVGSLSLTFDSCRTGEADYIVDGQTGRQTLTRLTEIRGLGCDSASSGSGLNQTASWYSPDRAGEGFIVQLLDETTAFINWFTFDEVGNPSWFTGIGYVAEQSLVVQDLLATSGGRFGPEHDPAAVARTSAGRLELSLGCERGRVAYDMADLPSGHHGLERLTVIPSLTCAEDSYSAPSAEDLIGQWQSEGFGTAVSITADTVKVYQTTTASCLLTIELPTQAALSLDSLRINQNRDRMRVTALDSVSPVFFDRVDTLPAICDAGGTAYTNAPRHNYEVFAATYRDLYAAFDVRGVDWAQQQRTFGPQVTASTSPNALFDTFAAMLAPLVDRHTTVFSDSRGFGSGATPEVQAYFRRAQGPEVDRIVGGYLDTIALRAAAGTIGYGVLDPGIGYLEVRSFDFNGGGDSLEEQLDLYRQEIDRVLQFFRNQGVEQVVLDVRRNEGGDSNFSFELARRFLRGRTRTLFSEQRLEQGRLTTPIVTEIVPSQSERFDGDLVLLTSSITGSAAEMFTLAIRALPHATLIGDRTAGVLSRTERILPNRWVISLTVGQIRTPEGAYFEAVGIPPHISAPVFTDAEYASQRDSALEAAMGLFQR